ncbi:MAG: L-histidine N(alpha)-methyltransferase, partial [Phycisphaerales bacterium]|nr:L-histidine N(alpha)-methyltransferase [Phycisphaerales bacterium]
MKTQASSDRDSERAQFLQHVLDGLGQRPRRLSPMWFYDTRGSELFEQITELPEYYLT